MHKANMICITFFYKHCVNVFQPFRCNADCRPFIRCPLCVTPKPNRNIIQKHAPILVVTDLSETCFDNYTVAQFAVRKKSYFHSVQKRIGYAPKIQLCCIRNGAYFRYVKRLCNRFAEFAFIINRCIVLSPVRQNLRNICVCRRY